MADPEAAVAIVRARAPEESILLIRRTERVGDPWSGHWSLPGGRREPEDPDLLHTALRELAEECAILLTVDQLETALPATSVGRLLGPRMLVAPFVFRQFPGIELNGVPLWGFTYKLVTDWLGVKSSLPDNHGTPTHS